MDGAAIRLTLARIPPNVPLSITTVNIEAFVDMPLAWIVISPAVVTLAFVLFLGGYIGTFVLSLLLALRSSVFLAASALVPLLVIRIPGRTLWSD